MGIDYDADALGFDLDLHVGIAHERVAVIVDEARPFKKESGTSVRKRTSVSKKGFSEAKADLSIAVLSAIRNNPSIRDYWIRKRKEKCGGIVLNAVKFKLVLRMFAVIKRGTPYVETDAYKN